MLNEMLLLDIHTHEAGLGQSGERPPSDLISRVRGYLEMRLPGKAGAWVHISLWGVLGGVCSPDFTSVLEQFGFGGDLKTLVTGRNHCPLVGIRL